MVDYFSFEDVMQELELSEEDLKRMVSEGELRAFRDENKMKFKKEDVDNLKKGRITEPTIILPSTPGGQQDETVLDLDISHETASLSAETAESKAVPAKPAKAPPPASDDLLLEPTAGETTSSPETEETFIEEESDTGLTTEPLKLADEVEAAETVESDAITEEVTEITPRKTRSVRRRATAMVPVGTEEEIERRRPHLIWTIFSIVVFIITLYSCFFTYDLLMMENGKQNQPSGLTEGLASFWLDSFWNDGAWRKFHERDYPGQNKPPYEIGDKPIPRPADPWYDKPSFMKPDRPTLLQQTQ